MPKILIRSYNMYGHVESHARTPFKGGMWQKSQNNWHHKIRNAIRRMTVFPSMNDGVDFAC